MDEKKRLQEELEYWKNRALTDSLTGLRNREALEEDLSSHSDKGFVFIDVDDFKAVNDTRGHEAGDQVLQNVADALRSVHGQAYRLGGEEFLIVCPGRQKAARIGTRAVKEVRESTTVTISAGVGDTIAEADQMMYRAKQRGKNQCRGGD